MSAKVNPTPAISPDPGALFQTLILELTRYAQRMNSSLQGDGTEAASAPVMFKPYTVAQLLAGTPSASKYPTGIVYVSNGTSNKRLAVSDGTTWRFPDGNVVS